MIEWLCGVFAQDSPGYYDEIVLLDSTPVECGRSVETAHRSELADACGYCRSHSRWFWGMRLHLCRAPDGTPRAAILTPADQKKREVALRLLPIALRGGEAVICDKGYAGCDFEQTVAPSFKQRFCDPTAETNPTTASTAQPSASGSRACFGRSKTASGSNATAPAP